MKNTWIPRANINITLPRKVLVDNELRIISHSLNDIATKTYEFTQSTFSTSRKVISRSWNPWMRPLDMKIDDLLPNTIKQAKHQQEQWLSIYLDRQTNYTCIIILHLSDFFNGIHITKFIGLVILLFLIYLMCCALFVKFSKKSSPFFTQCQIDVLTQDVKIASFK